MPISQMKQLMSQRAPALNLKKILMQPNVLHTIRSPRHIPQIRVMNLNMRELTNKTPRMKHRDQPHKIERPSRYPGM